MSGTEKLVSGLMGMLAEIHTKASRSLDGLIYLSVEDARALDEESRRRGNFFPVSQIKAGDTGSLFGYGFQVVDDLKPGIAYVGHRVASITEESRG